MDNVVHLSDLNGGSLCGKAIHYRTFGSIGRGTSTFFEGPMSKYIDSFSSMYDDLKTLVYVGRRHWHNGKCGITTKTRAAKWLVRDTLPLCGNCR